MRPAFFNAAGALPAELSGGDEDLVEGSSQQHCAMLWRKHRTTKDLHSGKGNLETNSSFTWIAVQHALQVNTSCSFDTVGKQIGNMWCVL